MNLNFYKQKNEALRSFRSRIFPRVGLISAILCLWAFSLSAQNDLCTGAITITCGSLTPGSTLGSTFDGVGFCGTSNTAAGVWYHFAGTGDIVEVSTCNMATYDTKITVFSGSCAGLVCVDGNDDSAGCAGFTSKVSFPSTLGTDYYILVHGFGTATGSFMLGLTCVTPIGNDACSGAITMTCGSSVTGSTAGATFDGVGFCGTSNTAPGVWYHFAGTGDVVEVSTCSALTSYDTKISVFSGSCGSLTCVGGDDDDFTCPFSGLQSTVFFASAGIDYYILVHGFGTATGAFELSLSCMPPPSNDDICDFQLLTVGVPEPFSNIGATAQAGEPSPGPGTIGPAPTCNAIDGWCSFETGVQNSVWFGFVATSDCIDIGAGPSDLQLAIWQAPGGCTNLPGLIEIAANDDGGPGLAPALFGVDVQPGLFYFVQVDGFAGAVEGSGTILVSNSAACNPPPPPCNSALTELTINLDNFPGETTWELRNDDGDLIAEGGPYFTPGGTVVEQLCSDPDCYDFTIFDSFGDGICCGFGLGSYTVTDPNGNVVASGGAFGSSETSSFCTTCEAALPVPWINSDIGAASGDAFFDQCTGGIIVESKGFSNPISDLQHTALQSICGDVEIIAKVESIVNAGFAGIQIRESFSAGSKKVALKTQLGNLVRRDIRITTNGFAQSQQFPRFGHTWLRLVRQGNLFFGFTSLNGVNWQPILQASLPMTNCVEVGLFTEGVHVNLTTTSTFTNVSITGTPAPLQGVENGLDLAFDGLEVVPDNSIMDDINLYPNPVSSEVNVSLGSLSGKAVEIQAFNELGQEVIRRRFDNASSVEPIPVNDLPSGMYFMNVLSDEMDVPVTLKFQVQNKP